MKSASGFPNRSQAAAREGAKKPRAPLTEGEVDLDCLIASAQRCGSLKGACTAKKLSWAAFYKELEIMNERKVAFVTKHLKGTP